MSAILKNVFKSCPGPLHNGENLPLNKFSKSSSSPDNRSKLCIECQKKELEDMPLKEKKRRGCPPGGWKKKETLPEKQDVIDQTMAETRSPSKPLPEISKEKPKAMPEAGANPESSKFDLSGFQAVTKKDIIPIKHTVTFRDKSISFSSSLFLGPKEYTSTDIKTNKGVIVFELKEAGGEFALLDHRKRKDINSTYLVDFLQVVKGKYSADVWDNLVRVEVKTCQS